MLKPIHPYGPVQDLSVIQETNAYCWVDIVVNTADAWVRFDGDEPSDLADPYFIARANETNRVPLLIGKSYGIRCERPFEIVGVSDPEVDVWQDGWSGELCVQWPVTMEFVTGGGLLAAPRLGSPSSPVKRPRVTPDWLSGAFSFGEDFCCVTVGADGKDPVFYCNGDCGCGGCSTGDVIYRYEGYSLLFGERLDCGCVPLPVSQVSLAGPAYLVYESASTNGLPLDSEPVSYTLDAFYQLRENGTLTLSCDCAEAVTVLDENGETVSLPCSWDASSSVLDQWQHRYFTVKVNGGDRAGLLGEFTLEYGGENSAYAFATCESMLVRVWIEAVETWPTNRARHVYGPLERFRMHSELDCGNPQGEAPFEAGAHFVPMQFSGFTYNCPIQVIHPQGIRSEFVREMTDEDWVDAGRASLNPSVVGADFVARWYLTPDTVSFCKIKAIEGEVAMNPKWGCFTNEVDYPPALYEHNMHAGAGKLVDVGAENAIEGVDYVGTQLGVPPICDGGYTLSIPLSWGLVDGGPYYPIVTLRQSVSVSVEGTTTVSKGNLSTTRGVGQ